MAQELLSPQMVMGHCMLVGWVATKFLVEAWAGSVCLLGEGGYVRTLNEGFNNYLSFEEEQMVCGSLQTILL